MRIKRFEVINALEGLKELKKHVKRSTFNTVEYFKVVNGIKVLGEESEQYKEVCESLNIADQYDKERTELLDEMCMRDDNNQPVIYTDEVDGRQRCKLKEEDEEEFNRLHSEMVMKYNKLQIEADEKDKDFLDEEITIKMSKIVASALPETLPTEILDLLIPVLMLNNGLK